MTAAEELRKEGRREGKLEIAEKMIQLKKDIYEIIELTGLSEEDINKIKRNLK
ncbi:hypothetical protein [Pseudogracilibacillus sp. SO30301A]|uniref:hypothetical protein n=1 Tax=Pseudogracilibacillus sp. SO30301A TaxID=3098291 RepID=UPI00300E1165